MDITYFPVTPYSLKRQKLKIAVVFNNQRIQFEIWLAGQNKQIQKECWEIFKGSDWNKYNIPETTVEGFSIVDHILIEHPNFDDLTDLNREIESGALKFINDMVEILE